MHFTLLEHQTKRLANTNDNLHFFVHFTAWLYSVHILLGKTMVRLHDIVKKLCTVLACQVQVKNHKMANYYEGIFSYKIMFPQPRV